MSRSSVLTTALATSLEDLDGAGNTAEINPVTSETVIELDEILEDVRGAGEEIAVQEDAADVLEDASASLESLIVSLESAVAAGGMSPQHADTHSRAMANLLRKLPVNKADYTLSLESFGGTSDKLVASMEALEGAKALLQKLWAGIRNAVVNAWNAVKGFYERLGKSGPAVIAAGKSLKQKAAATKGTPSGKILISQSAMNYLSVGGKFDGAAALAAVVQGYEVGVKGYGTRMLSSLSPLIATAESGQVTPQRLQEAAAKIDPTSCLTEDMKGKLPGGYYFDLTIGDGDGLAMLAGTSLKLSREKGDNVKEGEYDWSIQAISATADKVIAIGNTIVGAKAVMGAAEKGVNQIVKAGTTLAGKGDTLDKEELAGARQILAQLNKASRLLTGCGPAYLQFMGATAKAAVTAGSAALKKFSEPKATA